MKNQISLHKIVWRILKMVMAACPCIFGCMPDRSHPRLVLGIEYLCNAVLFDSVASAVTGQGRLTVVYWGLAALGAVVSAARCSMACTTL